MTEDIGKTARFFQHKGKLYIRAVNKLGTEMWFNCLIGVTSVAEQDKLETIFQREIEAPKGE